MKYKVKSISKKSISHFILLCFYAILLEFIIFFISSSLTKADVNNEQKKIKTKIYFFWGNGCPHCEKEKLFLKQLQEKYPEIEIIDFEVWYNKKNADTLRKIIEIAKIKSSGVPTTIVDSKLFIGFNQETAKLIEETVKTCIESEGCVDPLSSSTKIFSEEQNRIINIPFVGNIDPSSISLTVFTFIIAGLDSFNPCAFFVLLFLLSLLIHTKSRKRMLIIGSIFVFFSGFIYFIFMSAWLNIFIIVGHTKAITSFAAVIAIAIALINIKDFFFFKKGVSLSIPESAKPKLFEKMRLLIRSSSSWSMITGAIILSITANFYELLCTAGFPMVYTRVLTLNNLSKIQYYLYLILYNVVYIIPLAVIVIIVTITLGAKKLTEWQGRQLKLISGLMMLLLGFLLLIKPSLLNNVLIAIGLLTSAIILSLIIILVSKKLKSDIAKS